MLRLRRKLRASAFVYEPIVACGVGQAHLDVGRGSDDAHSCHIDGSFAVVAIADGAGSAPRGGEGAERLASAVVECLKKHEVCVEIFKKKNGALKLKAILQETIGDVRNEIIASTEVDFSDVSEDKRLAMFHATLVGFLVKDGKGYFFHIGDGLAFTLPDTFLHYDEEWYRPEFISYPEEGEYINQTFFFTMPNWQDHLRIRELQDSGFIIAMSDGVSPFVLNRDGQLDVMFLRPILQFVEKFGLPTSPEEISRILSSPESQIVNDDKTLVIVQRRPIN